MTTGRKTRPLFWSHLPLSHAVRPEALRRHVYVVGPCHRALVHERACEQRGRSQRREKGVSRQPSISNAPRLPSSKASDSLWPFGEETSKTS